MNLNEIKALSPRFAELVEAANARGEPTEIAMLAVTASLIALEIPTGSREFIMDLFFTTVSSLRPDFTKEQLNNVHSYLSSLRADFDEQE